jgi:hypothetical protein
LDSIYVTFGILYSNPKTHDKRFKYRGEGRYSIVLPPFMLMT